MEYNTDANSSSRLILLGEMEKQFDERNVLFFESLLEHDDYVIRTRSVCILANIAGEKAVESIARVLKNDTDALVRHEAAFSLGQLGFTSGTKSLAEAVESDSSFFVRHEAAVALGVIGSEDSRKTLVDALADSSEEVRESAIIALANLDYLTTTNRNNSFTKMTGG